MINLLLNLGIKDNITGELKRIESSIIRTMGAITASIAAVTALAFPIIQARDFEREMANVAKTTGYTDEEIDRLSDSLNRMSGVLGVASTDLASIAAQAGQLGLGSEGVAAINTFTESVARASVTLGMSVQETAKGGAQLSAIFNKSVGDIEKLFSVVNELSNNSVAAGGDIIDVMKRVGTASGATLEQVAALSVTMTQLGIPNEQAGTALVKFLGNLLAESEKFADAMGISQTEWVKRVQEDSVEALKYVLTNLSQMEGAEQASLTKKLFGAGRLFSAASKLVGDAANDFQVLDKMLGISSEAFEEGTSSIREYERIMRTVTQQTEVLKSTLGAMAIEVGSKSMAVLTQSLMEMSAAFRDPSMNAFYDSMGDGVAKVVAGIRDLVKWVAQLDINWQAVVVTIKWLLVAKLGAMVWGWGVSILQLVGVMLRFIAIAPIFLSFFTGSAMAAGAGAFTSVISGLIGQLVLLTNYFLKLGPLGRIAAAGLTLITNAIGGLALAMRFLFFTPIGLMITAIAGLGLLAYTYWDEIKEVLGYSSLAEQKAKRDAENARLSAEQKYAEIIGKTQDYKKKMDLILNDKGTLKGGDRKVGYTLTMDAEQFKKEQKLILSAYAQLSDAVTYSKAAVEQESLKLKSYANEVAKTTTQLDLLVQKRKTLAETPTLTVGGGRDQQEDLAAMDKEIAEVSAHLKLAQGNADNAKKAMNGFAETGRNAATALAVQIRPLAEAKFDALTAGYTSMYTEVLLLAEAHAVLTKKREELNTELKATQDPIKQGDLKSQIDGIGVSIDGVDVRAKNLSKAMDKLYLTMSKGPQGQQGLVNSLRDLPTNDVKLLNKELEKTQRPLGDAMARSMKANASAIIFNYVNAKKLQEQYGFLKAAADDYAKKAESVFNNTANEVIALRKRVAELGVELRETLVSREITLKMEIQNDEVDAEVEKKKKKIEEYYDKLMELADEDLKKSLEAEKEKKLKALETLETRKKGDIEANSLREQFNNALSRSAALIKEANKAAKDGNLDLSSALKEQAKDLQDSAGELIKDMAKIKTVDVFGDKSFEVPKYEIDQMMRKLEKSGVALGEGIGKANKSMYDQAQKVAEVLDAAFTKASSKLTEAANAFSNLSSMMSEESMTRAINVANKYLDQSVVKTDQVVETLVGGIRTFGDGVTSAVGAVSSIVDGVKTFERGAAAIDKSLYASAANISTLLDRLEKESTRDPYGTAQTINVEEIAKAGEALGAKSAAAFRDAIQKGEGVSLDSILKIDLKPVVIPVDTAKVTEDMQNALTAAKDAVAEGTPVTVPVTADITAEEMHRALNAVPAVIDEVTVTKVKLPNATMDASGAKTYSHGGDIRGSGTGLSDSILAWVSNGEYIIDSVTRGFFGSGFFSWLQRIAHGGVSLSGGMPTKQNLPAFAGGGPVFADAIGQQRDVVDLNFRIGKQSYALSGNREQVKNLVNAMKALGRSV